MKITILGLGIIGTAWARNLIADGNMVKCWNRTPKDLPRFHASIADAIEGAEAIFIVVADPPAVNSVIEQITPHLRPGQWVIQSSTISAKWTRVFARQVEATGARFLEAPFTGSKVAAENRQTVFYLGGDPAAAEEASPFLRPISSSIQYIGPLGSASTLKLAMNANIAGVARALCESLSLCRKAGIPDDTYFKALALNASHSGVADVKEPKLRKRDYSPQFSVKHMDKDLRLALETAEELKQVMKGTRATKKTYEQGIKAGWAEDDFIGLVRLLEEKPRLARGKVAVAR